ncbi:hypothetical protein BDZ97DRAFT_1763862 [Flammula alnicola]|nr:hypothetical protein BDZ97DRAFT_1763862 [Flammula alnicola]
MSGTTTTSYKTARKQQDLEWSFDFHTNLSCYNDSDDSDLDSNPPAGTDSVEAKLLKDMDSDRHRYRNPRGYRPRAGTTVLSAERHRSLNNRQFRDVSTDTSYFSPPLPISIPATTTTTTGRQHNKECGVRFVIAQHTTTNPTSAPANDNNNDNLRTARCSKAMKCGVVGQQDEDEVPAITQTFSMTPTAPYDTVIALTSIDVLGASARSDLTLLVATSTMGIVDCWVSSDPSYPLYPRSLSVDTRTLTSRVRV